MTVAQWNTTLLLPLRIKTDQVYNVRSRKNAPQVSRANSLAFEQPVIAARGAAYLR